MRSLAFVLFLAPAAPADEVELTSGRVIEGKVEDLGDSIKIHKSGGSVTYPKFMVKGIVYKKTVQEIYQEKAKAIKDDVESHLKLARWCLDQKLREEALAEFRRVIALEPDHEEARAGLGFRMFKGKWMTEDEVNEAKGLVRHRGQWMTPEERDLAVALEEQKELEKKFLREVSTLLEKTHSGDPKKRDEAKAALAKIDDQYKVKAYLAAVTTYHKHTRGFVIAELGRMKEPAAAKPLARRAIWDEDASYRAAALQALRDINHPDTALFLAPYLEEEALTARVRTAEALASFPDLRAAPILAEALENAVESIKLLEANEGQITGVANRVVILRDGTRMTIPRVVRFKPEAFDREQMEKLRIERNAVLSALGVITGQSFGDDVAKWRAWIQKKKAEQK